MTYFTRSQVVLRSAIRAAFIFILIFFFVLCVFDSVSQGQIVRLTVQGDGFQGRATAVCVGQTGDGGSVYVTARHNFEGARSGVIQTAGETHRITSVNESRTDDVASFEIARQPHKWNPLADVEGIGQECWVAGFGPEYNGSGPAESFSGTLQTDQILGDGGLHPVVGDSGGPVLQRGHVVGIVSGYVKTMARSDYAERGYPTIYCGLRAIRKCLQQSYRYGGCGPNGCPIYLRPQVQQPMIGIGIPIGRPRVVGVATPVPPSPQIYQPLPQPTPDPISIRGERGPAGPQGERGPAGRSVSQEDVESVVNSWLDANRESLRGPIGPQGERGMIGMPNEEEMNRWAVAFINNDSRVQQLLDKIDSLEAEVKKKRTITIVQGEQQEDGTIKKGETRTYDLDKPVPIVTIRKDLSKNDK